MNKPQPNNVKKAVCFNYGMMPSIFQKQITSRFSFIEKNIVIVKHCFLRMQPIFGTMIEFFNNFIHCHSENEFLNLFCILAIHNFWNNNAIFICNFGHTYFLHVSGMCHTLPGTGTLAGSAKALGPTMYVHMPQGVKLVCTLVPGTVGPWVPTSYLSG